MYLGACIYFRIIAAPPIHWPLRLNRTHRRSHNNASSIFSRLMYSSALLTFAIPTMLRLPRDTATTVWIHTRVTRIFCINNGISCWMRICIKINSHLTLGAFPWSPHPPSPHPGVFSMHIMARRSMRLFWLVWRDISLPALSSWRRYCWLTQWV